MAVKVGEVYKTDGNINVRELPLKVKIKALISHTIDNSMFLSGDKNKLAMLKEESEIKKIDRYQQSIAAYLSSFEDESEFFIIYEIEDEDLVKIAIGHPQFSVYQKQFLKFNQDLQTLNAYLNGVLQLRRVL